MTGPRIGSLFTGYGGLDHAVRNVVGGKVAWVSDIDKGACKILTHRYPDLPNLGDISAVDWADVEPVDVLTGGFPCQDVSHAGKRAGLRPDTRSGLWSQMAYAIDQLRPALVVAENVRGLLSAKAHSDLELCPWCLGDGKGLSALRALGAVLGDLADLGYDACWYGLRAADVGAPHGRYRVFVVAYPREFGRDGWASLLGDGRTPAERSQTGGHTGDSGTPPAAAGDPDGPGLEGRRVGGGGPGERAAGPTGGQPLLRTPTAQLAVNGGSQHPAKRRAGGHGPTLADEVEHLLPTPAVNDMGASYTPDGWDAWTDDMKAKHGNGNGHGKSLAIEAQRLLPTCSYCGEPRTRERCDNCDAGPLPLLPTPRATDGTKGGPNQRGSSGDLMLPSAVGRLLPSPTSEQLLPTPCAEDAKASGGAASRADGRQVMLHHAVKDPKWGDYADAIHRWEHTLGRPAPDPTVTSSKGNPQLAPAFVEWMMGLPAGWVTDTPHITRNQALKALGNGVVPAQAEAALRLLLPVIEATR